MAYNINIGRLYQPTQKIGYFGYTSQLNALELSDTQVVQQVT